jgi:hypothetical protein
MSTFKEIHRFPGYRFYPDGTVESCWMFKGRGRGQAGFWYQGGDWKKLSPDYSNRSRPRYRLRTAEGESIKRFAHQVVAEAFGEQNDNGHGEIQGTAAPA